MNVSCSTQIIAAIELQWTPDHVRDNPDGSWGTYPTPPPGAGWTIANFDKERRTQWQRPVLATVEEG